MATKVFIIGRPGSGKTEASLRIEDIARNKGVAYTYINDYPMLYRMYTDEIEKNVPEKQRKFSPANPDRPEQGFTVRDFSVLDDVLKELQKQADEVTKKDKDALIIVELARDNYKALFEKFSPDFYKDSHVIFLETDVNTSVQRINKRAERLGRGAISKEIMQTYYGADNWQYMISPGGFRKDFGIDYNHFLGLRNQSTLEKFLDHIGKYSENNLGFVAHKEAGHKIMIMVGPPGSGKDTYAIKYIKDRPGGNWTLISSDRKLYEIGCREGLVDKEGRVLYVDVISNPLFYEEAIASAYKEMKQAIAEGKNIILSRTFTTEAERAQVLKLIPQNYEKTAVIMKTPVEMIRERLKTSPKAVPYGPIADRIRRFEPVNYEEGFDKIAIVPPDERANAGLILPSSEKDFFTPGKFPANNPQLYDPRLLDDVNYKPERNPEIIIMAGAPYSGKTTWTSWHKLLHSGRSYVVISDDHELYKIGVELGITDERGRVLMTDVAAQYQEEAQTRARAKLREALAEGRDIIIDQANAGRKERAEILKLVPPERNYIKKAVFMNTPEEEIKKRWQEERTRGNYGKGARAMDLRSMLANLTPPAADEGFNFIESVNPSQLPISDRIVNGTDRITLFRERCLKTIRCGLMPIYWPTAINRLPDKD